MSKYNHKIEFRADDGTKEIVNKVRDKFSLSSDSEAIRFIINLFWKSLGTEAVDEERLGQILGEKLSEE